MRRTKRTVLSIYHPVFLFPDDKHFQFKSTSKALVLSLKQMLHFLKNKPWMAYFSFEIKFFDLIFSRLIFKVFSEKILQTLYYLC